MKRLYAQIFLTVLGSLLLFALIAAGVARALSEAAPDIQAFALIEQLAVRALPGADASPQTLQASLQELRARVPADLAVFGSAQEPLAQVGEALPAPDAGERRSGRRRGPDHVWNLRLPDGRWLVARMTGHRGHGALALTGSLLLLALAVGVAAYPLTRRLTRRLERLQAGVEALGAGDLSARVEVEGRDEVAALAERFNRSAQRIEELVRAHQRLLANASHELRSPLARIRMASGMLAEGVAPQLRDELSRDIAELDALVDEILLSSRLDAVAERESLEEVDLLALAAEECARADAMLSGEAVVVQGEARLLRRLVRNLLDNARRHGGGAQVSVSVGRSGDGRAQLLVCDRGPGVPEAERERIFEPFYRPAGGSEKAGGVGLGLALVRQIAGRHGGEVACEAAPGGGGCFRVLIPCEPGAA